MKLLLRHQALLILISSIVVFPLLGSPALFNDSESIVVSSSAEMFRQQVWLVPRLNDQLETNFPPFVNWLMLVAFRSLEVSEFSARFPSALLAVGTVLLTYHLGRKLYSSDIGLLAGLILSTCLLFAILGRTGTIDMAQTFLVTASLAGFVWIATGRRAASFCRISTGDIGQLTAKPATEIKTDGAESPAPAKRSFIARHLASSWRQALPTFVPLGLAVLAAGPLAFILPSFAYVLFVLISMRFEELEAGIRPAADDPWWRRFSMNLAPLFRPRRMMEAALETRLLSGLVIVAIVALPWYLAIAVQTDGTWVRRYLTDHVWGPVFHVQDGYTGFPFYVLYQVIAIHLGCYPWAVFLPVAACRLWERLADGAAWRDSDRLLASWIAVWFVFYSLALTKLPNSLLPIYPAIAVVLARYFNDWKRGTESIGVYSFILCCRAMWIAGVVLALGLTTAAYLYFPKEQWITLVGFIPVIGALIAAKILEKDLRPRVIRTLVSTALLFVVLFTAVIPLRLRRYQDSPMFLADVENIVHGEDFKIATFGYIEPSLPFYTRKPIRVLQAPRDAADFLASGPHAFVLTKAANFNELREELRAGMGERSRHRSFLKGYEIILVGRM